MMKRALLSAALLACGSTSATEPQQLTNIKDMYPSVSPDGETLVFQSNRSGRNEIWGMNVDGSGLVRLTETEHEGGSETPVISPDGQHIVYARYLGEGNNDVFVMNRDGTGNRQLSNSPGYDGHPHWSADGSQIVFNSDRGSPDLSVPWSDRLHDIYVMEANGDNPRQLTRCQGICTYGSLSPDGTRVLYRHSINQPGLNWSLEASERNSEVFVADLDGSNPINLSQSTAFDGWPVWSPDGQWIAFASNRAGPARTAQVWLIRPDGSGLKQLTQGMLSHVQPAWNTDSNNLHVYRLYEAADTEFGGLAVVPIQ